MEGISCPRKHILNYSETRYMEIMGNIESEISAGMRGKAPASDLSAKEKRFLESDRGQSTGGM